MKKNGCRLPFFEEKRNTRASLELSPRRQNSKRSQFLSPTKKDAPAGGGSTM